MREETIQQFIAEDSTKFTDRNACAAHEALCRDVNRAMAPMGKRRDIDSRHYVQHTAEALDQSKSAILALLRKRYDWPVLNNADHLIQPFCVVGRLLCDAGGPLNAAWFRFMCTNWESCREYEQPYFARTPNECTTMQPL